MISTCSNRERVALSLQQPTGVWTNGFGWDRAGRLANVTSAAGSFGYTYPALTRGTSATSNLNSTPAAHSPHRHRTVS